MDERVATKNGPRSAGKALTGHLLGAYWRYRVGDCRVICDIQDGALRVRVVQVGERGKMYRLAPAPGRLPAPAAACTGSGRAQMT